MRTLQKERTPPFVAGLKLSIVHVKKIVSPRLSDMTPEAFRKVRGLVYKVVHVALGTEADMKAKLNELDGGVAEPPPRKRA